MSGLSPTQLEAIAKDLPDSTAGLVRALAGEWQRERIEATWLLERASPGYQYNADEEEDEREDRARKDRWVERKERLLLSW